MLLVIIILLVVGAIVWIKVSSKPKVEEVVVASEMPVVKKRKPRVSKKK